MLIRDAQVEDAPVMGQLMVTAWLAAHRRHIPPTAWERRRERWTPEVSASGWERCLRERDASPDLTRACYLVAEDNQGSIVGVAAAAAAEAEPTGTLGEVGSLYVHPDHQTRGIGRRLVRELAARLEQMGVRSLHVEFSPPTSTPSNSMRRLVRNTSATGTSTKTAYSSPNGSTPGPTSPTCWDHDGTASPSEV